MGGKHEASRLTMRMLQPSVRALDTRTVKLPPKVADSIYSSEAFIAWRAMVLKRAGYRCEAMDDLGHRCTKARPGHRLFADHVRELKDGGSLTDPMNGQCLCMKHHERKSYQARVSRMKEKILPLGGSKSLAEAQKR